MNKLPSIAVKSTDSNTRVTSPRLIEKLSKDLASNYGMSDNALKDLETAPIIELKNKEYHPIIMLNGNISGKVKTKDSMKNDIYTNSVMNTFLFDLVGWTDDDAINKRMKNFRSSIIAQKEIKTFPHVFLRMQTDVKKRQTNDIIPN
jgi:Pyruvate/2-oxoacid:ferredoxin oxidoreductase gamma subunit